MIVIPSEVLYKPKFTYIWTLGVGRFPDALRRRVARAPPFTEIARCFLTGAGMTVPGELARVTGLSRPEAGLGNRALVAEGFADDAVAGDVSTVATYVAAGLQTGLNSPAPLPAPRPRVRSPRSPPRFRRR